MKLEFIFKQVDEILEKQYTTEKTKDLQSFLWKLWYNIEIGATYKTVR